MSAMLQIQKGVPIPTTTARKGTNIELLKQMEVGDSVYFDAPIVKRATRFYRVAAKLGMKVLIRKDGEGMRMWRIGNEEIPHQTQPSSPSTPKPKAKPKAAKKPAKKAAKKTPDAKREAKNARARARRAKAKEDSAVVVQ